MNTIVHTCLRYPPATGGVETYVQDIVEKTRNLDENRDVRVLTSAMRTHAPISYLEPESLVNDPMYVQRLHAVSTPFIAYPRLQGLSYYLKHHKPNIIHAHSFWYQPADVAARFAQKHGIPFVFNPMYYENKVRQKPIWQLYKKTTGRKTFALADAVIVISPFEQKLIENAGFSVKQFVLIPPAIDVDKFNSGSYEEENKTPRLLMVSRLAPGKGIEDMLHAMPEIIKEFPAATLRIVGEDFGAQDNIRALIKTLNLADHVSLLGKVSNEKLLKEYANATAFIHTSYYEAFGIVLAEASAAGLPVIARNVAAIPFVIQDRKTGLLFNSQEELVTATLSLLRNKNQVREMSRLGKAYVRDQFSWSVTGKTLIDLYENLCK